MKQLILTYHELHLSDEVADTYSNILNTLGITPIIKEIPNNKIKTLKSIQFKLSTYARNRLSEIILWDWDMSIETFVYNYSICEIKRKRSVGNVTIEEIRVALSKLGYNWCSYCRNCPIAKSFQ